VKTIFFHRILFIVLPAAREGEFFWTLPLYTTVFNKWFVQWLNRRSYKASATKMAGKFSLVAVLQGWHGTCVKADAGSESRNRGYRNYHEAQNAKAIGDYDSPRSHRKAVALP
jgi:hypothetical protein